MLATQFLSCEHSRSALQVASRTYQPFGVAFGWHVTMSSLSAHFAFDFGHCVAAHQDLDLATHCPKKVLLGPPQAMLYQHVLVLRVLL